MPPLSSSAETCFCFQGVFSSAYNIRRLARMPIMMRFELYVRFDLPCCDGLESSFFLVGLARPKLDLITLSSQRGCCPPVLRRRRRSFANIFRKLLSILINRTPSISYCLPRRVNCSSSPRVAAGFILPCLLENPSQWRFLAQS